MKRRSFITALAGLPIMGRGFRVFGQDKLTAKGDITNFRVRESENGLCSIRCVFTPALNRTSRPSPRPSKRPVDFEVEILKALTG